MPTLGSAEKTVYCSGCRLAYRPKEMGKSPCSICSRKKCLARHPLSEFSCNLCGTIKLHCKKCIVPPSCAEHKNE